ncbi:MAG: hypothetical protein M3209_15160 [Acidobacteriota bacterium]|nr:hypothetical protein [Acidobacteriota bacterium]
MKFAKLLAVVAVIIFAAIFAFMLVGVVMNILWYLFVFALIGAAAYGAYKLFAPQKSAKRLDSKNDLQFETSEFDRADRLLDEYKKNLSLKQ